MYANDAATTQQRRSGIYEMASNFIYGDILASMADLLASRGLDPGDIRITFKKITNINVRPAKIVKRPNI